METVGVAVGIVGLAGLFNSAVECFEYVQLGRSFGTNFQTSLLKLDHARLRLSRWGESVGLSGDLKNVRSLEAAGVKQEDIEKAEEVLGQILDLFDDVEKRSAKFKHRKRADDPDLAALEVKANMDSVGQSLHEKMRKLCIKRQNKSTLAQKSKWALYEERYFKRLIEDIKDLVDTLPDFLPAVKQEQRKLCEDEVREIGEEGLPVLREIVRSQDKELEAAISAAIGAADSKHGATFHTNNTHSQPNNFTSHDSKIGIMGPVEWYGDMHIQQSQDPLRNWNAIDAPIYSSAHQHEPRCLEDTRIDLLNEIDDWADRQDDRCIFWLSGLAGTGKSTIARTVAHKYDEEKNRLAASFFFSRGGSEDVRYAKKFATSLAVQLMHNVEASKQLIKKALNSKDIATISLEKQWRHLILGPLSELSDDSCPASLVLVVDALDECENEKDIGLIVRLLAEAKSLTKVRLRILLTSRPEAPIQSQFNRLQENDKFVPYEVVLHDIPPLAVNQDIDLFLRHEFECYRQGEGIEEDWPKAKAIDGLVQKASGLFIWAATAFRFICEGTDVDGRLHMLLEGGRHKSSPEAHLDSIYTTVLQASVPENYSAQERKKYYKDLRTLLGGMVTLLSPLSADALFKVLRLQKMYAGRVLKRLNAIIAIPKDNAQLLRLHHPSFRDFLLSGDRCSDTNFLVDEQEAHRDLAIKCLQLMSSSLQQGACGIDKVCTLVTEDEGAEFKPALPSELQYACHYWIEHFVRGGAKLHDGDEVHGFLQEHFLHWLEALCWMGKLSQGIHAIGSLSESMTRTNECREICEFVRDMKRFTLYSRAAIEKAPLQVYCSALVFAPSGSIVKKQFADKIPGWIKRLPQVDSRWGALLQTLKEHSSTGNTVAFSPNSKILASASSDINLWDVDTGAILHTLENHSFGIRFSPNGKMLVSSSYDKSVKLWDVYTGQLLWTFSDGWTDDVAFSPDSRMLAFISHQINSVKSATVELWNLSTFKRERTFACASDRAGAVTFSPEGTAFALVFDSYSKTASVLNVQTGKVMRTVESYGKAKAALSPNGNILASVSREGTVKLWDATTGAMLQVLNDNGGGVTQLIFSPDGTVLASASYDNTLRLWEVHTGEPLQTCVGYSPFRETLVFSSDAKSLGFISSKTVKLWKTETAVLHSLMGHSDEVVALAFSPNGKMLASISAGGTVKLWDAGTETVVQTTKQDLGGVKSMAFSPDGKVLASVSGDKLLTIKLWDVSSGSEREMIESYSSPVLGWALSPDGTMLACTSQNWESGYYVIGIWNFDTKKKPQRLKGHSDVILKVAFSPDSRWLASASRDGEVKLWDLGKGRGALCFKSHSRSITAVGFSPNGALLAIGLDQRDLALFDICQGKIRVTLSGHSSNVMTEAFSSDVMAAAFSPDGSMIASISWDETVELWDVSTGDLLQTLRSLPSECHATAVSSDGEVLAIASRKGTVQLWDEKLWHENMGEMPQKHSADATLSRLLYSDNPVFLHTNFGSASTGFSFSALSPKLKSPPEIFVSEQWVYYRGSRVLWLPPEYRANCVAVYDDIVALGRDFGLVSLLEISDNL
ncbi:uncharacterized protein yc1106_03964 [Curvularia clavata]|uniref:NACHT domain-containing protein n=1 Tax=Curvularia clavata TaxID=95742 RepID=A0A9Q9DS49_CURCL|nr:uncharacterized protein yc1106_03964 [Curvularia clavata]